MFLIIVLLFIGVFFMIFIFVVLFLDSLYRPNISQYPFNIFLDRIIPLILIISPTLLILLLNPNNISWLQKFSYIILIHIIILIPVMHYWSHLRRWNNKEDYFIYYSWTHPRLYKDITITLIYPAI